MMDQLKSKPAFAYANAYLRVYVSAHPQIDHNTTRVAAHDALVSDM